MQLRRSVFFGTPAFAVATLDALETAHRRPVCVVTQPARRAGRGRQERQPPVAEWALERGVELLQPRRIRDDDFLAELRSYEPDVAIVVAFGQIFPPALLALPKAGCINLHGSLLPTYRGAAPVAAAIRAGDRRTGVTTMIMEEGLDSGPILLQREMAIQDGETTGELERRMAELGAELVIETLDGMERGTVTPEPQDESLASYARRLKKEDGRIDWSGSAEEVFNQLRAYTPWPGCVATLRGKAVKVLSGRLLGELEISACGGPPGSYLGLREACLAVRCGEGIFGIESVQRSGGRALAAGDFANGLRLRAGELFG